MIVHNPTDNPVRDYPIQDPKTGEVALWSILGGETLEFPDFVGSYLVGIYGFLQRIVTEEELAKEEEEKAKTSVGQQFSQVKVVPSGGLTNSMVTTPIPAEALKPKNPVVTPPSLQPDMIGKIEGDKADVSTAVPTITKEAPPKKARVICPECHAEFQNKAAARTHYAHNHLKVPGLE